MNTSDALEIQVTNFGPIVEANVDLRPFTLFVGPSNTGKSYLAIMIYALHRLFSRSVTNIPGSRRGLFGRYPLRIWEYRRRDQALLSDSAVRDLTDWARRILPEIETLETSETSGKFSDPLPEKIAALIGPVFTSAGHSDYAAEAEITRCFGLESPEQLVRSPGTKGARVVLRRYVGTEKKGDKPFVHKIEIPRQGPAHLSTSIPAEKPLCYEEDIIKRGMWRFQRTLWFEHDEIPEERKRLAFGLVNNLAEAVFPYIIGPVSFPAHYLPADRTGVMHAHRVVVSALVERATSAGIQPASPVPMLSGVLADFLEQLIALGDRPRDRGRRRESLAARLEKAVLGGTVRPDERTKLERSYPSFSYRPDGWKESLPLMRASSMVSELAPVVLYLRYVVRPGDVLIIEEPESHLHPAMQVEFTRLLAAAVRAGIRIIMTTHSEWVLEELANLVRSSALPKAERRAIEGSDVALAAHEVGAWLFQPKKRPKGSIVQEIPLDLESGTFAAGYDDVAAALHNRWAEISSRSEEDESQ